jgi:RecA-family ATPase
MHGKPPPEKGTNPVDSDIDTRKLTLTLIQDHRGDVMKVFDYTLPEWRDIFLYDNGITRKSDLLWVKGALFGKLKSKRGSYRHNANVEAITAVMVEHDTGKISFDDAIAVLNKATLRWLAYTSPSYKKNENEKWRLLLPLSCHAKPEQHQELVATINGLLDGQLADESFTLSQSYYFGLVNSNPDHRCEIGDGDFLELRPDLAAGRIFKGGGSEPPKPRDPKSSKRLERNVYQMADATDRGEVRFALSKVNADDYWVWMEMGAALADEYGETGRDIFHEWSDTSSKYQEDFCDEKYNDFAELTEFSIKTVFYYADETCKETGEDWRAEWRSHDKQRSVDDEEAEDVPLPFVNIAGWDEKKVPEREWSVPDVVPLRNVFMLSGEGAAGKSSVALQRGAAHMLNKEWFGMQPKQGAFLYFTAEEEEDEIHRRMHCILNYYGARFADIEDKFHLLSYAGEDAVLAATNRAGIVKPTPLFEKLIKAAIEKQPVDICIDTVADIFAGNELSRPETRQFIGLLRKLAITANASVSILSHPSLTGINTGTGLSGSTGWHNSVRARAYLTTLKSEDEDEDEQSDLRLLKFKKNNYGPIAKSITLRWEHGIYKVVSSGATYFVNAGLAKAADDLFLKLLKRFNQQGRYVSGTPNTRNYAPTMFFKEDEAKKAGVNKAAFEDALRRLFVAEKVVIESCGAPSRGLTRLASK